MDLSMFHSFRIAGLVAVLLLLLGGCRRPGPPFSPKDSLQTLQIEPGLRIEVFAAEPDVVGPVDMEVDEFGRIYVVEDRGYPLDTQHKLGRVRLLQDTNGDGRPDRVTVFADQLVMPTGVMRWKKGLLVTDAPDIWYLEDTDGDGRADIRRAVLTGFSFVNPQSTVNNPIYGLDNWIYLATSTGRPSNLIVFRDRFTAPGGDIRFPDRPDLPGLAPRMSNIRVRLDTHQIENLAGTSQFGQEFDVWGHHFGMNNSVPSRHDVIARRYLERNPDLLVRTSMHDLTADRRVYPTTENPRFEMLTNVGEFTSACGLTLYQGGAFPPGFENSAFVAEPTHNLVHRQVWSPSGATFTARRAREGVEFLASRNDPWFRPVNFYVGPDGALYLLDFYRLVIEHPEWTSREVYESDAIYKGQDRGRIYRIVPESNAPPLTRNIRLGDAGDEELVRHLASPNIWWRRNAQRLLVDRQSTRAVAPLVQLFSTSGAALARLHALWTLDGLGKLDLALIEKALGDPEAGVRENAILLAEPRLAGSPKLVEKLLSMLDDPAARVRFQLLCTLGYVPSGPARSGREKLLLRDLDDRWFQVAALSASSGEGPRLFDLGVSRLLTSGDFFRQVCSVIAARQKSEEIQRVLQAVMKRSQPGWESWQAASLEGLAQGSRGSRTLGVWKPAQRDALMALFASPAPAVRRASLQLLEVLGLSASPAAKTALQRATTTAEDRTAPPELRADSVALLALADPREREPLFRTLVNPHEPEQVQAAAVRALGKIKGNEVGWFLAAHWRNMTSSVRTEAADALYRDPARVPLLVDALKKGDIQAWTLNFGHKRRLIMHRDESIRNAARPLLVQAPEEREKVFQTYKSAVSKAGDAARGEQVYKRICAKCHKLNGAGAEVGPDLGEVRNRPAELLLADILMPSRSIAAGYEAYVVETTSSGTLDGVLGPQTPTSITIRQEEGKEHVIRRDDIKQFYATNLSAMPGDLEKQIDLQQMADLLKFLKTVSVR